MGIGVTTSRVRSTSNLTGQETQLVFNLTHFLRIPICTSASRPHLESSLHKLARDPCALKGVFGGISVVGITKLEH